MDQFPQMLYRAGGKEAMHGGYFATRIVSDQAGLDEAIADGWAVGTAEALALKAEADKPKAEAAEPTRAELEQKAAELGLKFDGRTGDKKLAEMILDKLKG